MENREDNLILNKINESYEKGRVKIKTAEELFDNIMNIEKDSFKMKDYTDSLYLLTVSDIEKYKQYPGLYKVMNKYKDFAEYRDFEFMFIKTNEAGIEKKKEVYEKFKKIYGDMLKLDETEYYLMVGAFGGTQGRTNQEVIKRMKEIFDIKDLEI